MTPDDYLEILRKKLNRFPKEDQTDLIEEIGSHIESGEEDACMGKEPSQRKDKLMAELGSPEKMAKGFNRVYQQDGLIDFLLVAIPLLLNTSINLLLLGMMPRYPWFDVRVEVIFRLVLIGIGIWRGSKLLILGWAPRTAVQIVGMLAQPGGYYLQQSIIWFPVLLGLVYLIGRVVWQNRRDTLIVIYGLLPLIIGGFGLALYSVPSFQISNGSANLSVLQVFSRFSGVLDVLNIIALAVIFLIKNRDFRWAALAIYGLILGSWVTAPREVLIIWVALPLITVLLGWWLDRSKGEKLRLAA
jgi:hypothetical protein